MLLLALGAVSLGVLVVLPRSLRVRRRARALHAQVGSVRVEIEASLAQLVAGRAETERLLRPWRQVLKWATHPLTMALVHSYRRRWSSGHPAVSRNRGV
jgi:hypothetical protein